VLFFLSATGPFLSIVGGGILIAQILIALLIWQHGQRLHIELTQANAQSASLEQIRQERDRLLARNKQYVTDQERLTTLLDTLSTPVIPITQNAVAVPLVGALDARRIQQIRHNLLQGIEQHRAKVAILDLTGMEQPSSEMVEQFVQIVSATKLMGCHVILTGMNTLTARAFLSTKPDWQAQTRRDLQAGIEYAAELPENEG